MIKIINLGRSIFHLIFNSNIVMGFWGFGVLGFWDILGHFGTFWDILGYLGTFGNIWGHLGTFGEIWGNLGKFGDI